MVPSPRKFREEFGAARKQGAKAAVSPPNSSTASCGTRDRWSGFTRSSRTSSIASKLVYYARRQDQMLASMHSNRDPGRDGRPTVMRLSVYESKGHYYFDHAAVCDLWAGEFGRQNLVCRIFERDRLTNGDIVDDFSTATGPPLDAERSKRVGQRVALVRDHERAASAQRIAAQGQQGAAPQADRDGTETRCGTASPC